MIMIVFFSRRFPIYRSYIIHRSICTLRIKRLNVSLSLQEKLEKAAENHVHRDVCLALLAKINTLEEWFLRVQELLPDTRGQDQLVIRREKSDCEIDCQVYKIVCWALLSNPWSTRHEVIATCKWSSDLHSWSRATYLGEVTRDTVLALVCLFNLLIIMNLVCQMTTV